MTSLFTPRTVTLQDYFKSQYAYRGVPVYHIDNLIGSITQPTTNMGPGIFAVVYVGERVIRYIGGSTLLYAGKPWSSMAFDRNNLAAGNLGSQLAYQEGSTIEREIDFGMVDYYRYQGGNWQICNLRQQQEGHWSLSDWRLAGHDPHAYVNQISHQRADTTCTCGRNG